MRATAYRAEIEVVATHHGLDPRLVEAIIWMESAGRADAFRFEPAVWDRMKVIPRFDGAVPRRVASSYGLMQILYTTALEEGFPVTDPPEALFAPLVNLEYGCAHLARLLAWAGEGPLSSKALAAYNGGRGNWMNPKAQSYASKVLAIRDQA